MLIQILRATRRVSVGTSVAKGRHGLTAQAARLRQGPVPALSRDLCRLSLEVPSSLPNSASLLWRSGLALSGFLQIWMYIFWSVLRNLFSQLPVMSMVLLVPKGDAGPMQRLEPPECSLMQCSSGSMCTLNTPPRYYSLSADLWICLTRLLVPASTESKKCPVQNELELP